MDAPYFFFSWGSPHTLFINKNYYDVSDVPGFNKLATKKVHFLQYAIKANAYDFSRVLDKSVLTLNENAIVDPGYPLREIDEFDSLPRPDAVQPTVSAEDKTANTVTFRVSTAAPVYMLYTDLSHPGFRAKIDGRQVPILKAMGAFKAVTLPPGEHIVEFIFQPFFRYPLVAYLVVSAGFVLFALFSLFFRLVK
jgi:hypothetical protein